MYIQLAFALDRVKALAPQHPGVEDEGAVQGRARRRPEGPRRRARTGSCEIMMATHAGMTTDEFAQDRRATGSRPPTPAVQAALHRTASTSRCSRCSRTCARTASRRSSSPAAASSSCACGPRESTAFRPSRSSAAAVKMQYEMRDGKPVLFKLPEIDFIDDRPGKPVGITSSSAAGRSRLRQLRRRLQMLEWTTAAGPAPRFGAARPPHRRRARIRLRPRLARRQARQGTRRAAAEEGWTVVSMKNDWRTIFPPTRNGRAPHRPPMPTATIRLWLGLSS